MARGPLAGASGPGKFSKRTDLPSAYYGEGVETAAIKSGAPLATTPDVRPSQAPAVPAQEPVTPLFAPTQRPNEPITSGIDTGEGPGSEALMMRRSTEKLSDILVKMLPYDTDGSINILYQEAIARGN
jgi:hypothetical protein